MYKKNSSGWFKHVDFILLDLLSIHLSFYLSYVFYEKEWNPYIIPPYRNMAIFIVAADLMIIFLFESYKNVLKRGYYIELISSIKQGIWLMLSACMFLIILQDGNIYSRSVLFMMCGIYVILTYLMRLIWKKRLFKKMETGADRSLFIITTSKIAEEIVHNLKEHNYGMFLINGIIIMDQNLSGKTIDGIPVVSDAKHAAEHLRQDWVDEVFIYLDDAYPYPKNLIDKCREMGLTVHLNLAKMSNKVGGTQIIECVGPYTTLTTSINSMSMKQAVLKRTIDICCGLVGCLATGLIFIFVAPIIYINSPGPIFFSQERIGQNGKKFKMYKFRSMYMDAEERKKDLMKENKMSSNLMFKMDFDPRIIGNKILPDGTKKTGIGQFIRSTSLDEFPQFWNVLIGDMSTVGFRPILPSEYEEYEFHHRARLAMKPGITGMWQVSGRSDITDFEEVVKLDTEYIKNWSMGLDFKILFKTVSAVLKKDGSM